MRKDFNKWNKLKKQLDEVLTKEIPYFYEREIWWCSIGVNIGFETYGKGENYSRPVLILKKHNHFTFYGLPLGSTRKKSPHLFPITTNGHDGSVLLSQGRTFSSHRLLNRLIKIPEPEFELITRAYKSQY